MTTLPSMFKRPACRCVVCCVWRLAVSSVVAGGRFNQHSRKQQSAGVEPSDATRAGCSTAYAHLLDTPLTRAARKRPYFPSRWRVHRCSRKALRWHSPVRYVAGGVALRPKAPIRRSKSQFGGGGFVLTISIIFTCGSRQRGRAQFNQKTKPWSRRGDPSPHIGQRAGENRRAAGGVKAPETSRRGDARAAAARASGAILPLSRHPTPGSGPLRPPSPPHHTPSAAPPSSVQSTPPRSPPRPDRPHQARCSSPPSPQGCSAAAYSQCRPAESLRTKGSQRSCPASRGTQSQSPRRN